MRFKQILAEAYNRRATIKAYGNKILDIAIKDQSTPWLDVFHGGEVPKVNKIPQLLQTPEGQQTALDYIMGIIETADPTRNKTYAQAIARLYAQGGAMLEDISTTLSAYIVKFEKLKNKKKIVAPNTDLMYYKSIDDFYSFIEQQPDPDSNIEKQNIGNLKFPPHNTWKYIYGKMDDQGRILTDAVVIRPLDKYAGYWWAKEYPKHGTTNRWCTAWEGDNSRFNYYNGLGPLYIIIPADRTEEAEKYQLQFESKQFKDYHDHEIGDDGINKLVQRIPAIGSLFVKQAVQYNVLPLMPQAYKDAIRNHSQVASKQLEQLITQYRDRIARFGFANLSDYGIQIEPQILEDLVPAIEQYIDQVMIALNGKDSFWSKVAEKLGHERNEDKLEVLLNTDSKIKNILDGSEAGKAIAELSYLPQIKSKIDTHHLQDLLLRDPIFRFTMRQVPKLYAPLIDELTGNLSKLSESQFNSKQEVINHFVKQGKSPASGAAAWESGWRGPKVKIPKTSAPKSPQQRYWWQDKDDDKQGIEEGSDPEFMAQRAAWVAGELVHAHQTGREYNFAPEENTPEFKSLVSTMLAKNGYADVAQGLTENENQNGFYVIVASEDTGVFIGALTKEDGKWRETTVEGNPPYNWGGNYMSYLTPQDIMQHIKNDFRRGYEVAGPFFDDQEVYDYANNHFDFGADDYDDDLDEDDWHGEGDAWHGAGNEPVDAWHSPDGGGAAVGEIGIEEDWQKVNKRDKTDGMSRKAVSAYRREHPGSKLKTAVTTKPSKLKKGSKAAKRRKSFCARMGGVKGPMKDKHGKPTAKAKALRRWNCESVEDVKDLLIIAESIRRGIK